MISTIVDKEPLRLRRFVPRYLDPASRLGEVLFGLIMVLIMTLTAGLTRPTSCRMDVITLIQTL
ncbi:MAG: hypothetical protein DMF04_01220 [Verrucomicrobia bacterium]|nr:MAG: hypothetical protein DMF04_01220 [Verrucomicrobiota bacterium]